MSETKDKLKLKPASDNIWYALATIAGEPIKEEYPVNNKNRYYWNGFMRTRMSEEELGALTNSKGEKITLPKLSSEEHNEIRIALDERGFEGQSIPDGVIDFSSVEIPNYTTYSEFVFAEETNFRNATFIGVANFVNATFTGRASFSGVRFTGEANIWGTKFTEHASFTRAIFTGYASFWHTIFIGYISFSNAKFTEIANFNNAKFARLANFSEAIFTKFAFFSNLHRLKRP